MPRTPRHCPSGEIFHVLNRAVARLQIFEKPEDYEAFLRVVEETVEIVPLPICSMIVMPNHWHFVVQPIDDKQVSEFFRRLTVTHTMRWHAHHKTSGTGHLYQGRFKSFPIQNVEHLLWVMRYVERNALRANLEWRFLPDHLCEALDYWEPPTRYGKPYDEDIRKGFEERLSIRSRTKLGRFIRVHFATGPVVDLAPEGGLGGGLRLLNLVRGKRWLSKHPNLDVFWKKYRKGSL